jgi:hypothetical protein
LEHSHLIEKSKQWCLQAQQMRDRILQVL